MPLIYPQTTREDFDRNIDPNYYSSQVKLRPASNNRRRVLLPIGVGYGESPDEELTRAIQLGNIDRAIEIFNGLGHITIHRLLRLRSPMQAGEISKPLAKLILFGKLKNGGIVVIDYVKEEYTITEKI